MPIKLGTYLLGHPVERLDTPSLEALSFGDGAMHDYAMVTHEINDDD